MATGSSSVAVALMPYPYQVAGHAAQGPLKLTDDGCVLKPIQRPPKGMREVVFYDTVFNKSEKRDEILQLRRLLPYYHGIVEIDTSKYLKLENITNKFQLPCVMDIKMGRVTWDDHADETFRERRRKKWPLKEVTGFSILGFMVYNHQTCCHEHFNDEWCRKLFTVQDAEKCFHQFLGSIQLEMTFDILGQLLANLVDIKEWFTTQRLFRFIASSILIVYEANSSKKFGKHQNSHQQSETVENMHQLSPKNLLVDAKIIDTAQDRKSVV